MTTLAGITNFLIYFGAAAALFAAFLALYSLVTPARDLEEIRDGNTAVALALGGAMLGFSLPLAMAIARSQSLVDMLVSAAIAMALQLVCFVAVRYLRGSGGAKLERGDMAEATLLAAGAVTLGVVNAACLT